MSSVAIMQETPQQSDVERLLREADQRSVALYPKESRCGSTIETLMAQNVRFFVVRLGGRAIGCGGFIADKQRNGELKRIFVEEAVRGNGIGRLILTILEQDAREQNISIMRLETGVKSVEAIGLYRRFGYNECGPFGGYPPDPLSVFMEKGSF